MKAKTAIAVACCHTATSFESNRIHHQSHSSCLLMAKKKTNGKVGTSGKGFGTKKKEGKYSINDKSYGIESSPPSSFTTATFSNKVIEQSMEEERETITNFFDMYSDWHPLFHNIMNANSNDSNQPSLPPLASVFLPPSDHADDSSSETIWGMSTLENRNPWRLLPAKPTSNSTLAILSNFLDEWQQSLLDIPLDQVITGDNDLHFLEEGRRTIAVGRFHVLGGTLDDGSDDESSQEDYNWEEELFRTCWSELANLASQDENETGSLILLPDITLADAEANDENAGLDYLKDFVETKLIQPIGWLGRGGDWEIVAMERGSLAVRMLYKLGGIRDLKERDSGGDETVTF